MRRTLLLLALLAVGFGGRERAEPIATGVGTEEVAARTAPDAVAFRSVAVGFAPIFQKGPGRPLGLSSRPTAPQDVPLRLGQRLVSRVAAFEAYDDMYGQHTARLALIRAGFLTSPATAPPPFLLF